MHIVRLEGSEQGRPRQSFRTAQRSRMTEVSTRPDEKRFRVRGVGTAAPVRLDKVLRIAHLARLSDNHLAALMGQSG